MNAHGQNQVHAAHALGLSRSTLQNRLNHAARRGLLPTKPVMPGFEIHRTSAQLDANGNLQKQWIQQREATGGQFELPKGHRVKGVSALVGPEGGVRAQWIKTTEDDAAVLETALRATFEQYKAAAELPSPKEVTSGDLLVVYPIADLHLGMFSWARETGTDYDLQIGSDALRDTMGDLVARSAPAKSAVVLDMGDYFHADNSRNQTARSGNTLDVDTRYAKVVQVGFELTVSAIELALQKHDEVLYRKLPGNHDEETSLMLAVAISAHFRNNPRVSIDTNPGRFFRHRFGKCLIAATHGDMLKMGDLAGFAATQWSEDWGATTHRYGYTGHVHNERALAVSTQRGMRVESFNTLSGKDSWHAAMGYQSPRNMVSITSGNIARVPG